jgi:hypothetical protein
MYSQFLRDCDKGLLPDYSFVEPNYSDHDTDDGEEVASDQHPDHDVQAGEQLVVEVYTHIKNGPGWATTALLVYMTSTEESSIMLCRRRASQTSFPVRRWIQARGSLSSSTGWECGCPRF